MVGYYAAGFGGPMLAIYYNHTEEIEAHTGGGFMYFLMGIAAFAFYKAIKLRINKMDSTAPKVTFNFALTMLMLYIISGAVDWITLNFGTLDNTLTWIMISQAGAAAIGYTAISIDKAYVKEVNII